MDMEAEDFKTQLYDLEFADNLTQACKIKNRQEQQQNFNILDQEEIYQKLSKNTDKINIDEISLNLNSNQKIQHPQENHESNCIIYEKKSFGDNFNDDLKNISNIYNKKNDNDNDLKNHNLNNEFDIKINNDDVENKSQDKILSGKNYFENNSNIFNENKKNNLIDDRRRCSIFNINNDENLLNNSNSYFIQINKNNNIINCDNKFNQLNTPTFKYIKNNENFKINNKNASVFNLNKNMSSRNSKQIILKELKTIAVISSQTIQSLILI